MNVARRGRGFIWPTEEQAVVRKIYPQHGAKKAVLELEKRGFMRTLQAVTNLVRKLGIRRVWPKTKHGTT